MKPKTKYQKDHTEVTMTRNRSICLSLNSNRQVPESEEKVMCISARPENVHKYFSLAAAMTFAAMALVPATAHAQDAAQASQSGGRVTQAQTQRPEEIENYWTAERLLSAKPFQIQPQLAADGRPMAASQTPMAAGASVKVAGDRPTLDFNASLSKELVSQSDLTRRQANVQAEAAVTPQAFSPIGATFTTSRVFPAAATHTVYPYSTVGALFWTDPVDNSNWFCSASVLRPRVVATAGHCVASPANGNIPAHFHTHFLFVPGYLNGTAPFGVFSAYFATTTATWYYSNGSVPNAQDVGLLDVYDRNGYKLGQYTGYLGYWTNQLSNNNVTMLGFPCNLDGCEQLEANYAQTYEYGGNNTYIFGSNFGGGSSGGPYIRDFGKAPSGSLTTEGGNWLIAVNSYGPVNLGYLYSGASNLNNEFLSLLTAACNAGGC
jgi:V8-like Glu-specific endopeptidase